MKKIRLMSDCRPFLFRIGNRRQVLYLTAVERQALMCMMKGYTAKQMASILKCDERRGWYLRRRVLNKVDVKDFREFFCLFTVQQRQDIEGGEAPASIAWERRTWA